MCFMENVWKRTPPPAQTWCCRSHRRLPQSFCFEGLFTGILSQRRLAAATIRSLHCCLDTNQEFWFTSRSIRQVQRLLGLNVIQWSCLFKEKSVTLVELTSVIKRHSVSSKQVLCLKWLFFYSEKLVSRLSNNWPFWNVPSRPDVHLCAFNCKLYAGITTTLLGKCLTSSGFNYCISSAAGGRSPVADSGMWDSAP